ncbi:hypothetical protein M0P25_00415 [archaeon]|jgi:hypothetical protein|nr:hypothetical protein [archaeon]MDD2477436.1 hypothetical protein [Candidatus ainarchaeum sp.]MDD3084706.1 hypothetical protein [Candidatus ainarchaeum sp.]MDD4220967.1 hypothetical protein [Candidatus ainarchaeum sp.]
MIKFKKPIIFNKSKLGKIKFEKDLQKDPQLKKKELALMLLPGEKSAHNISTNRKRDSVQLAIALHSKLINKYYLKMKKINRNAKENKIQILHTHIIPESKKDFAIALPSKSDILAIFKTNSLIAHKYEFIAVIDPKGKAIGYTTIKINKKLNVSDIKKKLLMINKNKKDYKLELYNLLPELGLEVYFTPEDGYRLDNNFNYVK